MISSKRIFEKNLYKLANTRVMMRTLPLSIKQGRAKGRPRRILEEKLPQELKRRDMGKVKYFACHKFGHYASQCLNKKGGKWKA